MKRGGGPRPEGSDGSDFSYRMTIDDRYRKAAKGKMLLRKYLNAQTGFQLLKALMLVGAAVTGDRPVKDLEVVGCLFGVTALVVGTLGLKRGASRLLKVYIVLMGLAIGLALVPLTSGVFYRKMLDLLKHKNSKDYFKLALLGLEGLQDVFGTVVNLMGLSIAATLVANMSPPKRNES
ncbi:hypothetical protein R1sor_007245 [Riccia sorocarpa]|uniref:Uncharacterized protein n=1 Tax=Riccia sorocarpa TaxID=122646 RepID=A0ABD3HSL9_9MARC